MHIYIDVVGRCNLRCPSCPMGNSFDKDSIGGSISPDLLRRILEKAVSEHSVDFVGLYNWTEPLLHPRIGELIQIVKSFGLQCLVSSNLNIAKRLEDVIEAAPDFFRISVSGFTNPVYQKHHRGGNVEIVKENLQKLAELRSKHKPATHIQVYYLRWLGNLDEESLMQKFAEDLGFSFQPDWAWIAPVEKQIELIVKDSSHITEQDINTVQSLARPFTATVEQLKTQRETGHCTYFSDYIVLDCAGRVSLCCAVYDQNLYTIGNYLDHSHAELLRMKKQDPHCRLTCMQCMENGLHTYGMNSSELNKLAIANVLQWYASKLGVIISKS